MTREFSDFARIIDEKDEDAAEALLRETLDVMRVIEKSARG